MPGLKQQFCSFFLLCWSYQTLSYSCLSSKTALYTVQVPDASNSMGVHSILKSQHWAYLAWEATYFTDWPGFFFLFMISSQTGPQAGCSMLTLIWKYESGGAAYLEEKHQNWFHEKIGLRQNLCTRLLRPQCYEFKKLLYIKLDSKHRETLNWSFFWIQRQWQFWSRSFFKYGGLHTCLVTTILEKIWKSHTMSWYWASLYIPLW